MNVAVMLTRKWLNANYSYVLTSKYGPMSLQIFTFNNFFHPSVIAGFSTCTGLATWKTAELLCPSFQPLSMTSEENGQTETSDIDILKTKTICKHELIG